MEPAVHDDTRLPAFINKSYSFPDLFVKVEVKTEHDIDVHLDLPEPNAAEASFLNNDRHEGFYQCQHILLWTVL